MNPSVSYRFRECSISATCPTVHRGGKEDSGKLDVSLDYLSGKTDDQLDARTFDRVLEVQKFPEDIREKLFYFIDMSIRDSRAKQAYAQ
ncbi:hypothetical protein [Parapedobacter sp. 10938]|uniref:hypothetical protein n=1 Tax=Parapedobacter flavus TaxID=3110225 RepID=UPI002DBF69F7|nr:hypothetical protein [Parapedobacter sp. 10938]MEC3881427.1 hypothetical protein [Parapedobacter sp. 10938]